MLISGNRPFHIWVYLGLESLYSLHVERKKCPGFFYVHHDFITLLGGSTASGTAIVHFGSVGRLCGLFERSKAT